MAVVFTHRSHTLQNIYAAAADNRLLKLESLEDQRASWARLNLIVGKSPHLENIRRDSHCREAVLRWVHHLTHETRELLRADNHIVPLLPEEKVSCPRQSSADEREACEAIERANVLDTCHTASFGPFPTGEDLPVWPASFRSEFKSYAKHTQGLFALGVDPDGHVAELLTFGDGTRDHLCSSYHNDTACTQLTTKGWKWLVWPEISKCCKCCSFENHCAPLAPAWLRNQSGNIHYAGIFPVKLDGKEFLCKKWYVLGLSGWAHPNYYYEHVPTTDGLAGLPCEIDGYNYLYDPSQLADDQYIFIPETFSTDVSTTLFQLPDFCKDDAYCGKSVCDGPAADVVLYA